jgi:hypothetical protein
MAYGTLGNTEGMSTGMDALATGHEASAVAADVVATNSSEHPVRFVEGPIVGMQRRYEYTRADFASFSRERFPTEQQGARSWSFTGRIERCALFANSGGGIRLPDHDFGMDAAEFVYYAKYDRCVCRNRNSLRAALDIC